MSPYRTNEENRNDGSELVTEIRDRVLRLRRTIPTDSVHFAEARNGALDYLSKEDPNYILLSPVYLHESLPEAHLGIRFLQLFHKELLTLGSDEALWKVVTDLAETTYYADHRYPDGAPTLVEDRRVRVELESKEVLEDVLGAVRRTDITARATPLVVFPIISYEVSLSDEQKYQLQRFRSSSLMVVIIDGSLEEEED